MGAIEKSIHLLAVFSVRPWQIVEDLHEGVEGKHSYWY